ncbi:MAG: hypothetical protein ACI4OT_05635 [Bacilli bacterium]
METDIKGYDLFWELYNNNLNFKNIISKNMELGKIRFFNDEEWDKINSQNFVSHIPEMKEFIDMFTLGYNIGNCVGASRQLSYSYNDVDIVSGILPILKRTKNAEKLGGHCWLETRKYIIDTSLMLVIDKSLKEELGYIEEQRIKSYQLSKSPMYQARKEYVNDPNIKNSKGKK